MTNTTSETNNSNENELKMDQIVTGLIRLNISDASSSQLTSIDDAIQLIKQQAAELEAARNDIEQINRIKSGVIDDLARLVEAQEYHGLHHEYQDGKATAYAHCIEMLSVDDYLQTPKPEDKQS